MNFLHFSSSGRFNNIVYHYALLPSTSRGSFNMAVDEKGVVRRFEQPENESIAKCAVLE